MSIQITGNASPEEAQAYVDYLQEKYNRKLESLDIQLDGEFADLNYKFASAPFERIRRITGYLVGRSSQSIEESWGDGKRAELKRRKNI